MNKHKILLLVVIACLIALFFIFDLGQYLHLDDIKARQVELNDYKAAYPVKTAIVFLLVYIVITGISLPGAGIMSVAGGAIFGLWWGTLLVSFASAIGATIAFLATRFIFHDLVQQRFAGNLAAINREVETDGAYYLCTLRLMPIFPYFIINILMALTPITVSRFYLATQISMLPTTMVFVNAGVQIARINEPGDILSPQMLVAFVLLGILPLLTKKIAMYIKVRRHIPDKALELPVEKE